MQLSTRLVVGIGAAALALTIGVGAALAGGPRGATTGFVPGAMDPVAVGAGTGPGSGGYGPGAGGGAGKGARVILDPNAPPAGTLTADQATRLAFMADEEKLALDLYTAFAARYSTPVWRNIASSEATHLTTVRTLLSRYGIADPSAGLAAGDYGSAAVDSLYTQLLAQGSASESAAFDVGRTVELDDIAKLDAAAAGVTTSDVTTAYASLRAASTQHLASFTRLLGR
jgi:hypothetical protein